LGKSAETIDAEDKPNGYCSNRNPTSKTYEKVLLYSNCWPGNLIQRQQGHHRTTNFLF